jgi:hypothetical protein
MSIIISELLVGEWAYRKGEFAKFYIFMPDITDVLVYSDHNFPKAEKALYNLKKVNEKHLIEIKHPVNKIEDEVYEIVEIGEKFMLWAYTDKDENVKTIKLIRFLGERLTKEAD